MGLFGGGTYVAPVLWNAAQIAVLAAAAFGDWSPRQAAVALAWGLVNRVVPHEELLPHCRDLAGDMASCIPEVLRSYKRLIDEGLRMPLGPALAMEKERAIASAAATGAGDVASRRGDVLARGRSEDR